MSGVREWVLAVEGAPFAMATAGCPTSISLSSADTGDPAWGSATILPGALKYPSVELGASLSILDSTLSVPDISLTLVDVTDGDGHPCVSYYATRHPSTITSTALTNAITNDSASFTVANASGIVADTILWIDAEAIRVDTPVGTTIPILERGYYGSRQTDHKPDGARYPEAWFEFPFYNRRRATLWSVENGVATSRYRGYIETNPETDGYEWKLRLNHVTQRIMDSRVGTADASCRIRGYDMASVIVWLSSDTTFTSRYSINSYWTGLQQLNVVDTAEELAINIQRELARQLGSIYTDATNSIQPAVQAQNGKLIVSCQFKGTYNAGGRVAIQVAGEFGGWQPTQDDGAGRGIVRTEMEIPPVCRALWIGTSPSGSLSTIQVDNTTGLPSAWTEVLTVVNSTQSVSVKPILRADLSDDAFLVVTPGSTTASPPALTSCMFDIRSKKSPGASLSPASVGVNQGQFDGNIAGILFVTSPMTFTLSLRVKCSHWILGVIFAMVSPYYSRFGLSDTITQAPASDVPDYIGSGANAYDWDFTNWHDVVRQSAGLLNAREWFLDGTQKFGQLIGDVVRLAGCAIMLRGSRLSVVPVRPPVPSDSLAADFSESVRVSKDPAKWSTLVDALSNTVSLEYGDGKIVVNDARSQQRYGQTQEVSVKLYGPDLFGVISISTSTLAQYLLGTTLGLRAEPINQVEIPIPYSYFDSIKLGDFVRINSSWFLPNQSGGRSYTLTTAQKAYTTLGVGIVIGISLMTGSPAQCRLTLAMFGLHGFAGYAPCARVASISADTLTLSKSYLTAASSTKNYDNSNTSSGDGGASKFAAGDRVRLILRNTTATTVQSFVVSAVNSGGTGTIKLTVTVPTSPTNWPSLAGSGIVDVEYDNYATSGFQDTQKGYCAIGDYSTNVIASTSDPARRWAP